MRHWLNTAGRPEQLLVSVGDGRGDIKAFGRLDMPHGVCCVRTRQDSRGCDLPQDDTAGRGRLRVYSARQWTPQQMRAERTGWRMVPVPARGRRLRLPVRVSEPCRRKDWGERVFFVMVVRGRRKRKKGQKSRKAQAFWVHAVPDGQGGWQLPLPLEGLLGLLWQRWEIEVSFRQLKSGFGLGEKPCWGLESGERRVAWSAWVDGALVWSGYRAWEWTGGTRWGGCRSRVRWSLRDVWWSVRCDVLGGGLKGVLWGDRVIVAEGAKNGVMVWCWNVRVLLSWLQAFRL